ncbi:unnamed protein product, partial [Effrenium voratum]
EELPDSETLRILVLTDTHARFITDNKERNLSIATMGYDNACKLWKCLQERKNARPPWSNAFT